MSPHDIIVIGASAGGVEALTMRVSDLPAFLLATMSVVMHLPLDTLSILPQLLRRAGPLACTYACAPRRDHAAGTHLYGAGRSLPVDRVEPYTRRRRPQSSPASADVLFGTAAFMSGARVIDVVSTGALDDDTMGLQGVKRHQGIAIVQAPHDVLVPSVPHRVSFSPRLPGAGEKL